MPTWPRTAYWQLPSGTAQELLSWAGKGIPNVRDRIFGEVADRIILLAPCDLILMKFANRHPIRTAFLPTAGGPNARLAASVLSCLASEKDPKVTGGYVLPEGAPAREQTDGKERILKTLELLDPSVEREIRVTQATSVAGGIAKASADYDVLAIGAAKERFFQRMLFGEIPEKVARYSPVSVMVVKEYEGLAKSLFKRIMG